MTRERRAREGRARKGHGAGYCGGRDAGRSGRRVWRRGGQSVKVFIVARVIFRRPPRFPWLARKGRARQGRGA